MLMMDNAEEILSLLERFTKLKQKEIPRELEDYLLFVAKTGDTIFRWTTIKALFREKLIAVIKQFYEQQAAIDDLPQYPNVDPFNYETLKSVLLDRLDSFNAAPFTIQRISELLTDPRKQYSRIDKFMRAVEKNILVVSTVEPGGGRNGSTSAGCNNKSDTGNHMSPGNGDYGDSEHNLDGLMVNGSNATAGDAPLSDSARDSSDLATTADIDVDIEVDPASGNGDGDAIDPLSTVAIAVNGCADESNAPSTTTALPPINTLNSAILAANVNNNSTLALTDDAPEEEDADGVVDDDDTDEDEVQNHLPSILAAEEETPAGDRLNPDVDHSTDTNTDVVYSTIATTPQETLVGVDQGSSGSPKESEDEAGEPAKKQRLDETLEAVGEPEKSALLGGNVQLESNPADVATVAEEGKDLCATVEKTAPVGSESPPDLVDVVAIDKSGPHQADVAKMGNSAEPVASQNESEIAATITDEPQPATELSPESLDMATLDEDDQQVVDMETKKPDMIVDEPIGGDAAALMEVDSNSGGAGVAPMGDYEPMEDQ